LKECLDRNNLFSVFSLLAGLNLTPVQRLRKTWAGIGKNYLKLHQDLEALSNPSKNMQAYRVRIANASPPVIPFLRSIPFPLIATLSRSSIFYRTYFNFHFPTVSHLFERHDLFQ